jgi:para-nitrobenzyl esterase
MQHPSKPLAKTRQGTLAGSAEQGIHIWRGIPYAAPPVGPLRWRAPQPRPLAGRPSSRRLFRRQLAGH